MSELSPKTKELVREGRSALQPNEADRERVLAALRARLGNAPPPGDAAPEAAEAGRALWSYLSAGILGLALVGGAVGLALRARHPDDPAALPPAASIPAPALARAAQSAASLAPPRQSAMTPATPAPSAAAPAVSWRRQPEDLSQEVAILSRAAKELRSGRAADALGSLHEHQSRFPNGALSEERRAAKTEALCALGRFTEARAELAKILRRSPHSALAARARDVCKARSPQF